MKVRLFMLSPKYIRLFNRWIVSTYKIFGFVVLISLVVGMAGYLTINAFFLFNRTWIAPAILNPQHEKVIQVSLSYMDQLHKFERLRTERIAIEAELRHIEYAIRLQEEFQHNFVKALSRDSRRLAEKFSRLKNLQNQIKPVDSTEVIDNSAAQKIAADINQLSQDFEQRVISRDELLRTQQALRQIQFSEIHQKERVGELKENTLALNEELRARAEAQAILVERLRQHKAAAESASETIKTQRRAVSLESLEREQQFLQAEITKSQLQARAVPLRAQLQEINENISKSENILKTMKSSPYVAASTQPVTIAFVSYENLPQVREGSKVLGCYLTFLFCKTAGKVSRILSGEVTAKHPLFSRDYRGVAVELELADNEWAKERALIVNRAPFLL
jgi:hypothetical protein